MKKRILKLAIIFGLATVMAACRPGGGKLTVSEVWARPGLANGNSAVYFIVNNTTGTADHLVEARSEVSERVELHRSSMGENGVMKMERQRDVPVPANGTLRFEQGGLHVMLINLEKPLEVGDVFALTLVFAEEEEITLEVPVEER